MKTITTTVYEYDELASDSARQKARAWYAEGVLDYEWWEAVYEDAARIGLTITSFDLDHYQIDGKLTQSAEDVAKAIMTEHGKDCETYNDATAYLTERSKWLEEDEDGYLLHEDKLEELDEEFTHTILEDYRSILQKEIDYLLSDEQIEESIRANKYTFTENGQRAG